MSNVVYLKRKFSTSLASGDVVSRNRLNQLLSKTDKQFKTIIAPAGFGKTTLIMDWIQQEKKDVVWVTLDQNDNEPLKFWKGLLTAFAKKGYHMPFCKTMLDGVSDEMEIVHILGRCINEIEEGIESATKKNGDSVLLVLDDLHQLTNSKAIHSFAQVLRFLPSNISLCLLSRQFLPEAMSTSIPVNQAMTLEAEDLAFTLNEGKRYIKSYQDFNRGAQQPLIASTYGNDSVDDIWRESEGWPIFFCAMVDKMYHRDERVYTEDDLFFLRSEYQDYINKEIVSSLPKNVLEMLQRLTLVNSFNRNFVIQCLCPKEELSTFNQLVQHSGLVSREGKSNRDYCIRRPVKTFFQDQEEWHKTQVGLATFSKAFRWYLAHDRINDAITLCIDNSYWQSATHIIENQYKSLVNSGNWSAITEWFCKIPKHIFRKRPLMLMLLAQKHLFECSYVRSLEYLQQVNILLVTDEKIDHPDNLYHELNRIKIQSEAASLAETINQLCINHNSLNAEKIVQLDICDSDSFLDMYQKGLRAFYSNQFEKAKQILLSLAQKALIENHGILLQVISLLGWIHYHTGELDKWNMLVDSWKENISELEGISNPMAWASSTMILTHLEQGESEKAAWHFENSAPVQSLFVSKDTSLNVSLVCAVFHIQNKQWAEAERYLSYASQLAQKLPQIVLQCFFSIPALKAELKLALGKKEEAIHFLEANGGSFNHNSFAAQHESLVKADILLTLNKPKEAIEHCSTVNDWAQNTGAKTLFLRSLIIESLSLQTLKKEKRALDIFQEALNIGRNTGNVKLFLKNKQEMKKLLANSKPVVRYPAYLKKLVNLYGGDLETSTNKANLSSLSNREKQVLDLLVKGLSNPEIAENLCRSLGTVKIHVHNIYRKLGVINRVAAIKTYLVATA